MSVPADFQALLPPGDDYEGPTDFLWVFDPVTAAVTIESNADKHPADTIYHPALANRELIFHPHKVEGYAYHIKNGWRLTDIDHRPLADPYLIRQILTRLP